MKKILFTLVIVSILMNCKNQNQNNRSSTAEEHNNNVNLSVDRYLENPSEFVDQEVKVSGMVAHVCKHGGQKLFLIGTLPDKYLRVNTGKGIAEFPIDLEGSIIEVKGVVTKIEADIAEPAEAIGEGVSEHDTSSLERAYHRDKDYVVVAESFVINDEVESDK